MLNNNILMILEGLKTREEKGFSIDLKTGVEYIGGIHTGYTVGITKGLEGYKYQCETIAEALGLYLLNIDLIEDMSSAPVVIGGWYNGEHMIYDICLLLDSKKDAIQWAMDFEEVAIYDLGNNVCLYEEDFEESNAYNKLEELSEYGEDLNCFNSILADILNNCDGNPISWCKNYLNNCGFQNGMTRFIYHTDCEDWLSGNLSQAFYHLSDFDFEINLNDLSAFYLINLIYDDHVLRVLEYIEE